MNVDVVSCRELSPSDLQTWALLQGTDSTLDSPFFCGRFAACVGRAHPEAFVSMLRTGAGRTFGCFPFERSRRRVAFPLGRKLSDFHGVVADAAAEFDAAELLRRSRLSAFRFSHLPESQAAFRSHFTEVVASPTIELGSGFAAYERGRKVAGSRWLSQVQRKSRKLERERGTLRFEWHTDRDDVFTALLDWKSEQRRRTATADPFWSPHARAIIDQVRQEQHEDFAGVLSALYVGDECIAAHFGMRSSNVLHFWFPAYSTRYAHYSPGSILLLELMKAAADRGLGRIDLGKGNERYKGSVASGERAIAEGWIAVRPVESLLLHSRQRLRRIAKSGPMRGPVAALKRSLRKLAHRSRRASNEQGEGAAP